MKASYMEFHVSKNVRDLCQFDETLFASNGNVTLANFKSVRVFAKKANDLIDPVLHPEKVLKAGQLNAMGLIDEIFHYICFLFRKQAAPNAFADLLSSLEQSCGKEAVDSLLSDFTSEFPPVTVYKGEISAAKYLASPDATSGVSHRVTTLEELILLVLANENPAFSPFTLLFSDKTLAKNPIYQTAWVQIKTFFKTQPVFGPQGNDLITLLKEPVTFSPNSLKGQLDYIRSNWSTLLGEWLVRLLSGIDLIQEEEKPGWSPHFSGPPPMDAYNYDLLSKEYERFSPDRDWMPRVVLMAKSVLVWLSQLTEKYKREITLLDQIPDEELDTLAQQGFNGLWLIGLWERSHASKRIKQINGNPEAAASAYSLDDYEIAQSLGGWKALDGLRKKLWYRGIRLASDMVPNHTGLDSTWMAERPDLFIQRQDCPFPTYTFNGENLSQKPGLGIYLEDHYYSKSDCAVVFKRVDFNTGDTRYVYHGNDGTGMPWNDTAQIDFLNPAAREEVIQKILHVARNFPIIRFDAAMVLAKKHIKRLWYPEPGSGGDIATRSESAMSAQDFEARIPNEFWREVVDRCAREIPDTLLLAEAFWMMEGYFVRTLGMHRVYNSAFMNMLKKEENDKYRQTVKNTLEFDPQVLKRFVNFMNNPDEDTAVAQFGKGDKYFGVCTLMVTMPGLPMFGHGQVEGLTEKYGMEYQKAYWNETPDYTLIERHSREIFPLTKKRYLFAEIEHFCFYDVWNEGTVNENIFAYSNRYGDERTIVFYNNAYERATGWIKTSCPAAVKKDGETSHLKQNDLGNALGLSAQKDVYCIFQEQRSGLWYLRPVLDIHQKGLFVALNGYESQVLLNFTEITDTDGTYKVLWETIGGTGVRDIDAAIKEIFLKDLYQALARFACIDFFTGIAHIFTPETWKKQEKVKKGPTMNKVLESVKKDALDFFETLDAFVRGNYGIDSIIDKKKTGVHLSADKIWKNFCARMKGMEQIKLNAENPPETMSKKNAEYAQTLYKGILGRENMPEILAAYNILYSIRDILGQRATAKNTADLIHLWHLDRKMREALAEYGAKSKELFRLFELLLEVTPCADYMSGKKTTMERAYQILSYLIQSRNAPTTLGLNRYNDVLWFNHECASETLLFAAIVLNNASKGVTVYDEHAEIQSLIITAFTNSQYDAERFVALLQPPQISKAGAKPSAKKVVKKPVKSVAVKTAVSPAAKKPVKTDSTTPAAKEKKPAQAVKTAKSKKNSDGEKKN